MTSPGIADMVLRAAERIVNTSFRDPTLCPLPRTKRMGQRHQQESERSGLPLERAEAGQQGIIPLIER